MQWENVKEDVWRSKKSWSWNCYNFEHPWADPTAACCAFSQAVGSRILPWHFTRCRRLCHRCRASNVIMLHDPSSWMILDTRDPSWPGSKATGTSRIDGWTPQIMGGVPNRHQNSIIFDHSWSYLVQGPVILNTNHTFGTSFEDFEKGEWRARRGWMIPSPDPLTQVCYKHQLAIQSSLHVLMHRHWSSNRRASLYKEVGFDHHLSLFWRHRFLESWEILTIRNLTKIYRN